MAFQCNSLSKMIIDMVCAYIKCMQSVSRTDIVGWTKFSYTLGKPICLGGAFLIGIQYNSVQDFVLGITRLHYHRTEENCARTKLV